MAQTLFYIILAIVVFEYASERILELLNSRHRSEKLPGEMKGYYDEDKYARSQQYHKVNDKFGLLSSTFSFCVMMFMLLADGFAFVDEWVRSITEHEIWMPLLFFGILGLGSALISLPFSIYRTFVIEEHFDFNKTTPKTFVLDLIKGAVLGVVIGGGLLAAFVWFFRATGSYFWIWAWGTIALFSVIITSFYTSWILPLFNKLTPLEEGDLRNEIERYCNKVGFKIDDLYVMDGSKRSSKSNAFFSGLGKKKKIVLFDTLVENHETDELVSILAHEVGHYKKKHTRTNMLFSILQTGLMLFVLSLFINNPGLSGALGAEPGFHVALLAFSILYSPLSMLLGIGMNVLSRKHEFEADRYAGETYDRSAMIKALKKLSVDNFSNLTPHPAYVFVNYSHPPVLKRVEEIKKL